MNWRELWQYRQLLYFLVWRDVKVRYKQAVLGIAWVILQPLVSALIFTLLFGRLARLPSEGVPYPLFALAGLIPWQLFAGALTRAGSSLVGSSALLTKVYFPRLVIPVAAACVGLVDLFFSLVLLLVMMGGYGVVPGVQVVTLPFFVLLAMASALAAGLWLSALNVLYRDVQYLIPFLTQVWMYASPVAYSASLVPPGKWQILYHLNPMTGVVQGFRWALLGTQPPNVLTLASFAMVGLFFWLGLLYFRRMERTFADVV